MDPQIKAQWVAALRSGDYQQGKNVLHNVDTNEYCCLGVLCDLAAKAGVPIWTSNRFDFDVECHVTVYGSRTSASSTILPSVVREWADLDSFNPRLGTEEGNEEITELNDMRGLDFGQLADLIEEQL